MNLLIILVSVLILTAASAFTSTPQSRSKEVTTVLSMGWLDDLFDKPIHGRGSGEEALDEQWEAQQAILRERRAHGIDKAHLKEKYSHEENRKTFDVGAKPQDYNSGDIYVEETTTKKSPGKKMKFPWEK
jgi:hypothetical protein